ncbi:MAG: bifunctional glutamine-synthetase adenylyltransferase/deadenyltransferase, partial [Lapillicoccus sp.]
MARGSTVAGQFARLGFADPERATRLLGDPALAGLVDPLDDTFHDGLPDALSRAADPDLALLGLVRVLESLTSRTPTAATHPDGHDVDRRELVACLRHRGPGRDRLVAVLGGSTALVDHLACHPEHWRCVAEATPPTASGLRAELVAAVGRQQRGDRTAYDALRVVYRRELLAITALDLTAPDPVAYLPVAAEQLAWLAEAALAAGLAIAREDFGPGHQDCRLAVIGMGKTGGGELNYVSDVDVIFVAEPAEGVTEERALSVGAHLAVGLMRACSTSTAEGSLWPVDAALRPEGKNGPLVRTIASHRAYYERWAKTWEFQALLKAWVSAGDVGVGRAYKEAISPFVWDAAGRDHFVEDVQAMRRRVEQHVPTADAKRQLKLGPGGLRDVEVA